LNVIFQYLKPGGEAPDSLTFPDIGFDFADKPIPAVGDHVVLPYTNEDGKRAFCMKKVIFRRFFVNQDGSVQHDVTLVVTDADNGPETVEVD
jgi:hypothetical protein